jgi:hypothetical protein
MTYVPALVLKSSKFELTVQMSELFVQKIEGKVVHADRTGKSVGVNDAMRIEE